eukprot:NODE_1757_length_1391_cov_20.310918_g1668_i0.p1 GENE.NODE_1757_length_1391_cov_20.310918_g1668_i0~~NODE_1757_length_1391_cov_20.310918_g1668_i0.p1  ORF type:complete len:423 (+),score=85.10 NODE_1757_length_1391_cov_20.310918_g1668_i0:76-1344(+)
MALATLLSARMQAAVAADFSHIEMKLEEINVCHNGCEESKQTPRPRLRTCSTRSTRAAIPYLLKTHSPVSRPGSPSPFPHTMRLAAITMGPKINNLLHHYHHNAHARAQLKHRIRMAQSNAAPAPHTHTHTQSVALSAENVQLCSIRWLEVITCFLFIQNLAPAFTPLTPPLPLQAHLQALWQKLMPAVWRQRKATARRAWRWLQLHLPLIGLWLWIVKRRRASAPVLSLLVRLNTHHRFLRCLAVHRRRVLRCQRWWRSCVRRKHLQIQLHLLQINKWEETLRSHYSVQKLGAAYVEHFHSKSSLRRRFSMLDCEAMTRLLARGVPFRIKHTVLEREWRRHTPSTRSHSGLILLPKERLESLMQEMLITQQSNDHKLELHIRTLTRATPRIFNSMLASKLQAEYAQWAAEESAFYATASIQ